MDGDAGHLMTVRFVFTPPADHAAGLVSLPWSEPLAEWRDERLVEIRQRGISRHVGRFVYDGGVLYAPQGLSERLARREYRLLRALAELNIPAVEVVGIAVDVGEKVAGTSDSDAVLVTKFLSYARRTARSFLTRGAWRPPTGSSTRWWNCSSG